MSTEHDPAPGTGAPKQPASSGVDESPAAPVDPEQWDENAGSTGGATRSDVHTDPAPSEAAAPVETRQRAESPNMLPRRATRRSAVESLLVRVIATCGVVGIGVAVAAVLVSNKTQGWIVGLVVAIVSVVLSAILWSSRQL